MLGEPKVVQPAARRSAQPALLRAFGAPVEQRSQIGENRTPSYDPWYGRLYLGIRYRLDLLSFRTSDSCDPWPFRTLALLQPPACTAEKRVEGTESDDVLRS